MRVILDLILAFAYLIIGAVWWTVTLDDYGFDVDEPMNPRELVVIFFWPVVAVTMFLLSVCDHVREWIARKRKDK